MTVNGYEIKSGAILYGAILRDAYLRAADLHGADLCGADLHGADLCGANLYGANLYGANLYGADLRDADLSGAILCGADLRGAILRGADLRGAILRGADLRGAILRGAILRGADLSDAKGLEAFSILPAGTIRGFKKLFCGTIAELEIPADAARVNAYGSRKCRASRAIVISGSGLSHYDGLFRYEPGKVIEPREPFCDDPRIECASGVHFFITRHEAIDY